MGTLLVKDKGIMQVQTIMVMQMSNMMEIRRLLVVSHKMDSQFRQRLQFIIGKLN